MSTIHERVAAHCEEAGIMVTVQGVIDIERYLIEERRQEAYSRLGSGSAIAEHRPDMLISGRRAL